MISHGKKMSRGLRALLSLTFLTASVVAAAPAHSTDTDAWDGNWHGSFTPYGWLPGVTAKMRFQTPAGNAQSQTDSNILSNLSGALMLSGDVRKGDWGFYGDLDWVKFDHENSRFHSIGGNFVGGDTSLNTDMDLKGGFVTLAGLYSLGHGQDGYADLIFGGRYLWLKNNLGWNFNFSGDHFGLANSGHVSSQTHVSDALVGIRGRWIPGGGNWYIPYYLDLGSGDSDLTSQAAVGVGYAFGWGDLSFAWRYVTYKRNDNALLQRLTLQGPALGLTWHF
jgi:hypothetical protein